MEITARSGEGRGLHWHLCHHLAADPDSHTEVSSPGMHSAGHSEDGKYARLTPKSSFIQLSNSSLDQADLV